LDYVLLLTEPTTTFMGEAFFEFATCELLIINLVLPRFKWNKKRFALTPRAIFSVLNNASQAFKGAGSKPARTLQYGNLVNWGKDKPLPLHHGLGFPFDASSFTWVSGVSAEGLNHLLS
jgi:hypothetical protein